ncbi:efflux RND transporter periplasmic adaptor subunit [Amphritea balenae]|uniref:HlyD family efflux transporter periplasmic adaptor subunit n=1 Tax=Amphritea balenae TaxID=452629 RepID=A0A3P1SKV3_9GAMM|nr:HlyD family efflux transporter periplasmic adaptor subunit [Amphritea balenae]RRC97630.1 HlyD family efflux transporter periplasmic adaptor subunit [Amphritea balenae]GGK73555.1 hypothetical protein GCM10007941_24470 [Amphritea balenae]
MTASVQKPRVGLEPLAAILNLSRRVRHAKTASERAFILVNETYQLVKYRQAALWLQTEGVFSLSGVGAPDHNSAYVQWLGQLGDEIWTRGLDKPALINPAAMPEHIASHWKEWLPEYGAWIPLKGANGELLGGLILARETKWQENEIIFANEWADVWGYTWHKRYVPTRRGFLRSLFGSVAPGNLSDKTGQGNEPQLPMLQRVGHALSPKQLVSGVKRLWRLPRNRIILAALIILMIPIRISVLAPGELVPANPAVIRSPLDGVVDKVLIQPNQQVSSGEALFELDKTRIQAQLDVAEQTLAKVQAEYRQQAQQALFDPKSKGQLALVQGSIAEKQAEVAYLRHQVSIATVMAPLDGIILFDAPSEWIGRPVVTGERMAVVTEEREVEIEAWLAPGDAIDLPEEAAVTLFLNANPLSPVDARVKYITHGAQQRPDGTYAYRVRAVLNEDSVSARVGLKGTVKMSGSRVPLFYWILRRPLAMARQMIGV